MFNFNDGIDIIVPNLIENFIKANMEIYFLKPPL